MGSLEGAALAALDGLYWRSITGSHNWSSLINFGPNLPELGPISDVEPLWLDPGQLGSTPGQVWPKLASFGRLWPRFDPWRGWIVGPGGLCCTTWCSVAGSLFSCCSEVQCSQHAACGTFVPRRTSALSFGLLHLRLPHRLMAPHFGRETLPRGHPKVRDDGDPRADACGHAHPLGAVGIQVLGSVDATVWSPHRDKKDDGRRIWIIQGEVAHRFEIASTKRRRRRSRDHT